MVGTPLAIDIGAGAVARLAPLLADRRVSSGGPVPIVGGPGLGQEIADILRPSLPDAEIIAVEGGSVEAASELADRLRGGFYDALVGIGGGRPLGVRHLAARRTRPAPARRFRRGAGRDRRRAHARRRNAGSEPHGAADGVGRDEPRP